MKIRVISAIVAFVLVFPFVYFGGNIFAFGTGIIAVLGLIEILKLKKSHDHVPFLIWLIALINYIFVIYSDYLDYSFTKNLIILASISMVIPAIFYKKNHYSTKDAFYLIAVILFLGSAFNSVIAIRNQGFSKFLYIALIPMITDTFAYLFGKRFGKNKLLPDVSPKKTWEGFAAGCIFGTIIPVIVYIIWVGNFKFWVIPGTLILSIVGQIGDLVFSKIKRENEIKDFSNIMPGHGGILDRLDSTIFICITYILIQGIFF